MNKTSQHKYNPFIPEQNDSDKSPPKPLISQSKFDNILNPNKLHFEKRFNRKNSSLPDLSYLMEDKEIESLSNQTNLNTKGQEQNFKSQTTQDFGKYRSPLPILGSDSNSNSKVSIESSDETKHIVNIHDKVMSRLDGNKNSENDTLNKNDTQTSTSHTHTHTLHRTMKVARQIPQYKTY